MELGSVRMVSEGKWSYYQGFWDQEYMEHYNIPICGQDCQRFLDKPSSVFHLK
jgi:hypothetical protein